MSSRIIIVVTMLASCASLTKLGLVAQKVEQRVPRPTPGSVAGVQIVIDTLEHLVRSQHGDAPVRPRLDGRKLWVWMSDYDADQICFGIEDYPAANMSITGTANPFDRVDMELVRSDGAKLSSAKRDKLADDTITISFRNDDGTWSENGPQYLYSTARACFATKEPFVRDDTAWIAWLVGDSRYQFTFDDAAAPRARRAAAP